jgi:hypothetical protein
MTVIIAVVMAAIMLPVTSFVRFRMSLLVGIRKERY